ncbi:uncharacterized protein LOC119073411 [Bradysia coprophila]|uniref:uncharacterized protein LOC119073411 n=1 Tax=Bradysia coprophila TaxID=38358 RepID=UPI00187DD8DD|nr:uncharacterized protein LOC119073411 [Bradysia coprophila]
MSSTNSQFFDHGTVSGKMSGIVHLTREFFSKWCTWKLLPSLVMVVLVALLVWLTYTEKSKVHPPLIEAANGTITFKGNQINFERLSQTFYSQLNNSKIPIAAVHIENAIVVASEFSNAIKKFSESLIELYLNNVTLIGQFHRTYLPNLRAFSLSQVINAEQLEAYQEKEYVRSVLFFDLLENDTWKLENVSNLGVNIMFHVNGFKFINVNRDNSTGKRELTVYVPYCNEILQNVKESYEILSLATCSITKSAIPSDLEYLNLFEVLIVDGDISEILIGMAKLQFLFLDLANTTIDISHLPKSLVCLSLSTVLLSYDESNSDVALDNLDTLSLGFNSMSDEIYDNFKKLFPKVDHVAAFGLQSANYRLLLSCYNARVYWVVVEEFNHNAATDIEKNFSNMLNTIGITSGEVNFLITLPKYSDSLVAFPLTNLQEHDYRFMFLGWYKFLSFEAYQNADKYVIPM